MTTGSQERVLHHGTTRRRAEAILKDGPDPFFQEPGGLEFARGFSTASPEGPFPTGSPEDYANKKAEIFPGEGGPAILEIVVPEEIIEQAIDTGGEIRFQLHYGLEELLKAWPTIPKRIL
jgi:hypothetical protein